MDSLICIAFITQMCLSLAICKADIVIYGMSEKDSFKTSFDEAIRYLKNNSSNTFIPVHSSQGLNHVIEAGLTLTSELQKHIQDNVFFFSDLNNQQHGIFREVLEFQIKNKSNGNITIHLDNAFGSNSKVKDQGQEIDALFSYLNRFPSPTKGLSVIVDDTQLGRDAFTHIVQKCSEYGREIVGHQILKSGITEESIIALNLYKSNSLFAGLDSNSFHRVINLTEEMGIISFNDNLRMFMTKRSATTITGICYKPNYNYYIADYQTPSSNATYIIDTMNGCSTSGERSDQLICFARNDGHIITQLDLNTHSWITADDPDPNAHTLATKTNDITSKPTITASIAGHTPPWIMHIDYHKTLGDTGDCGREGMRGIIYNGSQQIDICIYGFAVDIFQLLRKKLNFNYRMIVSRDGKYGTYNIETNTSSGIVREIVEGKADIALDLTENKARAHVLWFSKSYPFSGIAMMYVKSGSFNNSGIFMPFHSNLWFTFLGSVVCVIIFIWALDRFSPYGRYNTNQRTICDDGRTFNIFDSGNYVWGTYFTGEIIVEKPKSFGTRVTIIVISIVAIVIIAAYSGNLITYLLVVDEMSPINGLLDRKIIGQTPTTIAATPFDSAVAGYLLEHSDPRFQTLYNKLEFCKYADCVNDLKRGKFDVLLYDYYTLKYITDIDKDCSLKTVRLQKDTGIGIVAAKSWTWKRRVDAAVGHMLESGEIDYLAKRWFGQASCKSSNKFYAIDIQKLRDLFFYLSVSVLLSSFVLVIELVWTKLACGSL